MFATRTRRGALGYGLLRVAPGLGVLAAGLGLSLRARERHSPWEGHSAWGLGACFLATSACFIFFASGPPLTLALALLGVGSFPYRRSGFRRQPRPAAYAG